MLKVTLNKELASIQIGVNFFFDQERVDFRHILKSEAKCIEHLCTNRRLRKSVVNPRELMVLLQSVFDLIVATCTCTCTKYHYGKQELFSWQFWWNGFKLYFHWQLNGRSDNGNSGSAVTLHGTFMLKVLIKWMLWNVLDFLL